MSNEATITIDQTLPDQIVFPKRDERQLAIQDFVEGVKKWPIWMLLAYQDIKIKYRRSVLGPFWITISMAITVYLMGYLYSHLFHSDLQSYYPFLVAGMLSWTLISGALVELIDTLMGAESMIKQIKLPYTLYIHRVIMRNLIIFFHNILVIVPILVVFHQVAKVNLHTLLLIPGLLIIYVNALFYGLIVAVLGARFRDVSQILKSLIQVIFFLTPIMWSPNVLPPAKAYLVQFNPFYAFIEMIRAPLMGQVPTANNLHVVAFMTIAGMAMCFKLFSRYRARIVYWL